MASRKASKKCSRAGGGTPRLDRARLERILDGFSKIELLVLGDVVLDEYLWGDVDRVSPEAPVPVVHLRDESTVLGGAGNVVRNVIALGGRCRFCSVIGDDPAGARVLDLLKELDVATDGTVVLPGRPTTRKSRVVARSQQIVRFDRETTEAIPPAAVRALLAALDAALLTADAAILEDYAKGLLTKGTIARIMKRLLAAKVPAAIDPKHDLGSYRGASLLKPNVRETEDLTGIEICTAEDLARAVAKLRKKVGPADIVVTRGPEGMTCFAAGDGQGQDVHTLAREVFDVQGAGDTTIAALELARAAGASLLEAAVIANAAAGVVVGKTGTATVTRDEIRDILPAAISAAREAGPPS
ncbi:MAG: bifunctional hydroxymethylpyrimidine kinase/phosphomethylpyrimidine kinase [Deltaproteobacteria bacterium]|nr:bifunctional hydroxymethylpyrimidine kinase/phosphomethylpyrimidine kinase [Deltaproteobacteria bacterium]MBW2444754.1 bifunctional hydroxymethylpyrimidine kinase/phosphomethylpyrimidine kinase [Deltaproteobacteria bacterium]